MVDNCDCEKGVYIVCYVNLMEEFKCDGLFGKLFYGGLLVVKFGKEYLINVCVQGNGGMQVVVVGVNGQIDNLLDVQWFILLLYVQLN